MSSNAAIPVKVDISSDLYAFWSDTFSITVRAPLITAEDDTIGYGDQTNIHIKCLQFLTGQIYYTYTSKLENAEAVTGNTSDTTYRWIKDPIQDTLYNTTDRIHKVVYTITPYLLKSDQTLACTGTPISVNIWVDTLIDNTTNLSMPIVRIYPNPADDIINIEISNAGGQEIEIELLTVSGQLIYRKEFKNSKDPLVKQIDLSGYAKGVYFVRIRQEGAVYNGKIIVM